MRRAFQLPGLGLALLVAVLVVRAASMLSLQVAVQPAPRVALDAGALAARLAGGLRFETVSNQEGEGRNDAAFLGFHGYLEEQYPLLHETLLRERVGDLSLLYTWPGTEPALPPIVLLAHQDVVPVEPGTEGSWQHPAFAGAIAEGFVWGRGALDDKLNLFGALEAVESLLGEGWRPRRTVLLAFGHDEELGGAEGAAKIAALLAERGVRPLLVVDEGGSILEGVVPGVAAPVAAVGIAEKGYLSASLDVEAPGGHSSTPAPETAIGILAGAITALDRDPLPARLAGASRQLLEEGAGPEATFPYRLVFANLWLFGPLLERALDTVPAARAMLRTTTAPTILSAGLKDNVIPTRAHAVVNFRILPGDSIESVLAHVRQTVADPRVTVNASPKRREPSAVSPAEGEAWELLARSIREVFPGAVVSPYLMLAGTDSRHFSALTNNVYRFMPLPLALEDTRRIHGIDERVSVDAYADLVRGYRRLLENATR